MKVILKTYKYRLLPNKEQEEIDLIARKNLDLINKLSEV